MPQQLFETDEEEKAAIRDILRESLRLEEKAKIRGELAGFPRIVRLEGAEDVDVDVDRVRQVTPTRISAPFQGIPELSPEQRAAKFAATSQRLIEERAQTIPLNAVKDLVDLEPSIRKRGLSFTELRKIVAERHLFPAKPGFISAFFDLGPKRMFALFKGILGFAGEKLAGENPSERVRRTNEALINRARILTQEVNRQMDEAGLAGQAGSIAVDLAEFAVDIAVTRGAGRLIPKKKIAKGVTEAVVKRGVSRRTAKEIARLATRSPEDAARFAAATALNAGLNTFAVTGNLTETTREALAGAAVGGAVGAVLGGLPVLGRIHRSIKAIPEPRRLLGLPETGPLTRQQVKEAAISKMRAQQELGAPPADIIRTAMAAEAIAKRGSLRGPSVAPRAPGAPKAPEPPKPAEARPGEPPLAEPTPKKTPRVEARKAAQEQPPRPGPEGPQARLFPREAARAAQEEVGARPRGLPSEKLETKPPPKPPARTPRDPPTEPNAKAFNDSAKSLEAEAAKTPEQHVSDTTSRWHRQTGEPAGGPEPAKPRDPDRLPIWGRVKGLRPVRKARVFLRRQQFVRLKESKTFLEAEVPASEVLLRKLTAKIEKAPRLRNMAESLKAQERRRRAAIMSRIQRTKRGEAGAMRAVAELKGKYPTVGFEPIGRFFSRAERDALFDHINTHRSLDGLSFAKARLTLVFRAILEEGHLPTRGELAELELVFGPRFARALFRKAALWNRLKSNAAEVITLPRTVITAYDLSATLRQGFSMLLSNPLISARSFGAQLRAFASERNALAIDRALRRGPAAKLRERAGLELTSVSGEFVKMSEREEVFMSRLIQKFANLKLRGPGRILEPLRWHGMGVRASERAYVTYLNTLRANSFDAWAAMLSEGGIKPKTHFQNYQDLAKFINSATGRGSAKFLRGPVFNAIFFAPRFMTSRFEHIFVQLPKNAFGPRAPLAMRNLAARQIVGKAMVWYGMAKLIEFSAEAFGVDVEITTDPRSSDFLKMRFGNTRIDMGAGYGQAIRLVARLATDKSVQPLTGKVREIDPLSEIKTFLSYKLSPVPSALNSIRTGETPSRDPATFFTIWEQLAHPISVQTLREVVDEHGARGLALMMPEILGVGIQVQEGQTQAEIQNATFRVSRIKVDRDESIALLRGMISRGVSPTQLRAALRAEAIEQARARALRLKERPSASGMKAAIEKALKSEVFRARQKRLNELIRATQP